MTCSCGHDADSQHDGHDGTPRYDGPCRECLCPAATDDPSPVETLVNGRWTLKLPPHRAYRPQWTTDDGWERARLDDMHAALAGTDATIIDVGSECGDLSVAFASWLAPAGRIVLAEPNPKAWPSIRACFEANALYGRVAATLVGFFGDVDRPQPGWDAQHIGEGPWPSCASGPLDPAAGFSVLHERPDVTAITIDSYMSAAGIVPTALTLDSEGAELAVLRGARATLTDLRPLVWVSEHPTFMPQYGYSQADLHAYMADVGYVNTLLAIDHEEHHRWVPRERAAEFA